jgi:glycosyltransferase involved in cell wall biosynthesis
MARRILILTPYPLHESPSQRFRFEQYFELLQANGYTYEVQSFLDSDNWRIFFSSKAALKKLIALTVGFAKRFKILFKSPMYDFIFIHREAAPVGPPFLEWILAKVLRKKIIYDFDDAIWLTDRQNESWILQVLKWRGKVSAICKWAYKVSCGNDYLCEYAQQFNKNVIYNPTTIDTENLHNPKRYDQGTNADNKIRIGWTGSHSTVKYLEEIEMVLAKVLKDYSNVELIVIADKAPTLKSIPDLKFIPWSPTNEINDLLQFDIGIMPLPDDPWSKGKCGFKALQYLSLEFPAVASAVGVNSHIISDGVNGFLCTTDQEWEHALRKLITDPHLRGEMGKMGRKTVVENYSVTSNASNFLSLFANTV